MEYCNNIFKSFVSTEDMYKSNDYNFYGIYGNIRKTLDYNYHNNYTLERQLLHDEIISATLKCCSGNDSVVDSDCPSIVFTAGAMGAGKSYALHSIEQKGNFPLSSYVLVDPDTIRQSLPEYHLYRKYNNPLHAGEYTRKEAGYIAELIIIAALQTKKRVLVDGTLRDWRWYVNKFTQLRSDYPNIKISILHVDAPRDTIIERATKRGVITGRQIPRETLERAVEQVSRSIEILRKHVDFYYRLYNRPGEHNNVEIVTEGITWETFRLNYGIL